MKLSELLMDIPVLEWHADPDIEILGLEADSRKIEKGFLFVAVKGYESDGHNFISSAVANGASCIVSMEIPKENIPYIIIEDTRKGLALLSANYYDRPADKLKIIGVTGTNGKTTTTNLVKTILETTTGKTVGLIGTNGNMIGSRFLDTERTTPESNELQELFYQMVQAGCTYVVMEVSSHALYLNRVYGIQFEVGVFTNLTEDHLDFHNTMDDYADAKSILFHSCNNAVINIDDDYSSVMLHAAECPILTLSAKNHNADFYASNISLTSLGCTYDLVLNHVTSKAFIGIPGLFSVYNSLSALSVAYILGIEIDKAIESLGNCRGVLGRAEIVPTGTDYSLIIDYAHTPDALQNIIRTVKGYAKGRVITLFGCGGDRDRKKRPIMGKIAADLSDFVVVTSDNPRTEVPMDIISDILQGMSGTETPYVVIENRRDAIEWSIRNAIHDDVIILAGKGHETYQIIGKTKYHFDEREEINKILEKLKGE